MAGAIPVMLCIAAVGGAFSAPVDSVSAFRGGAADLAKSRGQWALESHVFRVSSRPGESVLMYGVRNRRFFTDHFYWGEAGAGALAGKHGGYFEGGASLGYQREVFARVLVEAQVFSGAGGGGGVREGGGWLVHPALGAGIAWNPRLQTVAQAGYKRFLNADIRSWTAGVSLNYSFWDVQ